jgi:ABC-type amino acid transport substrate-binding protein
MPLSMGRLIRGCGLALALWVSAPLAAEQMVRVAGVYFPPYVFKADEQSRKAGLLADLLDGLNQQQTEFRFVMVPTSIKRRFGDFQQGRIDLAIFENPAWDWQNIAHSAVDMGLEDSEVFVSQVGPERDQRFFEELEGKRLALYHGYHYAFADFNAEPEYLIKRFKATLTHSHDSNLLMVLRGRADIALVTRSYIGDFLERYPEYAGQLLVSERADQLYRHHALLRPGAPIRAEQFSEMLETLRRNGRLAEIFGRYQVRVVPAAADTSLSTGSGD